MRRWGVFLICLFFAHVANAQEQNEEEKAKIKEIKLSGNYYFADVTMDKVKDALELALRNLILGIQSDLSVGKEIEPRVEAKWQHIALPRAGKQWVCLLYTSPPKVSMSFLPAMRFNSLRVGANL